MKASFLQLGTLAAAALAGAPAHAAGTACVVELVGSPDAAWATAVASLEKSLPPEASEADCARVSVELGAESAELVFATRDGRSTRRLLAAPAELAPTVQALRVSYGLPIAVAEPELASAEKPDDEAPPSAPVAAEAATVVKPPRADALRVAYGLSLGTRGSDSLHSPTVETQVSLGAGLLDLSLMLRFEGHYTNSDAGDDQQPETSAVGGGVGLGARIPAGPTAVAVGGHIMLAAFHQEDEGPFVDTEGRIGAYAAVVFPRRTRTRVRVGASAEMTMSHIGEPRRDAMDKPIMPWFALLLTIGVEYGEP